MRKGLSVCAIVPWLALVGCFDGSSSRNTQPVSLGIFEVVDCKPAIQPMTLSGSTDKYCLAAQPLVTEADVRGAQATTKGSNQSELDLFFTLKVGERLRTETQRTRADHRMLAIVIDGKLVSAPTLSGTIADTVAITNVFTREEAKSLAARLNTQRPARPVRNPQNWLT
jgi:preprotein translocase subunit SecD